MEKQKLTKELAKLLVGREYDGKYLMLTLKKGIPFFGTERSVSYARTYLF